MAPLEVLGLPVQLRVLQRQEGAPQRQEEGVLQRQEDVSQGQDGPVPDLQAVVLDFVEAL